MDRVQCKLIDAAEFIRFYYQDGRGGYRISRKAITDALDGTTLEELNISLRDAIDFIEIYLKDDDICGSFNV